MADSDFLKSLKQERDLVASNLGLVELQSKHLREKLETLEKAISNLEPFYEIGPVWSPLLSEQSPGITDAVRNVYRANPQTYLAPTEIRDTLKQDGLIKAYDNEMAVVRQVIRRLIDQDQLETHPTEKAHRWKLSGRQYAPGNSLQELAKTKPIPAPRPVPHKAPTMPPPGLSPAVAKRFADSLLKGKEKK